MTEKLMSPKITDPKPSAKITKTDAEWKQQLTPEQYQVARACGTEPAFTGLEQARRRHLPLRVLWRAAFWLGYKI